jgi:hypothetical protein
MSGHEVLPHRTMTRDAAHDRRRMVELDKTEALALLASVDYGRVVFTQAALPAIRPVNHLLVDERIIIRSRLTAAVSTEVDAHPATVVAYEADQIDPVERLGWSVVVTGFARPLTDAAEIDRLRTVLVPWVDMPMDAIIAITLDIVTGYRLTPAA